MINYETFQKIKELNALGLSKRRISLKLHIAPTTVERWKNADEQEFEEMHSTIKKYLEQYKEYLLSELRLFPQIRITNLYFKVQDEFPDFECSRVPFYRYVSELKHDYGFDKFKGREAHYREEMPPGYEAQVDFGQSKLKDMYGNTVRVYFFCMILSYSRMKFVHFSIEPFTTKTAIEAHDYAFRYFGGRTQTIMYDQDRVFVVSENLGNIIFVNRFEAYVKEKGYSVVLCRPHDPQTKGKVENLVYYVKKNFLEGRTYTGIPSLNSAALRWLDSEANEIRSEYTMSIPRVRFLDEIPKLIKVNFHEDFIGNIRPISSKYDLSYESSRYRLDKAKVEIGEEVRIEEDNGILSFYRVSNGEKIYECQKAFEVGSKIDFLPSVQNRIVAAEAIKRLFPDNQIVIDFINGVKESCQRYQAAHYLRIGKLTKVYPLEDIEEAMEYCLKAKICTANELCAFLIYRHGEGNLKKVLGKYLFFQAQIRAKEMEVAKCLS